MNARGKGRFFAYFGLYACLLFMLSTTAGAQHLSLRNNLVYDAALTPNLGFDVQLSDHWSAGANVGFRPWPSDDNAEKKWRHLLVAPELRRWKVAQDQLRLPKGDSLYRSRTSYWGLNLIYSHYNVGGVTFPFGLYKSVRDHRKQGDLAAVGAFAGYTWRLSRLLRLEAELGLGVGYAWAKNYECPHCGAYLGRDDKPFLVPKLALNIVLDPQKRQQQPVVLTQPAWPVEVSVPDKQPTVLHFNLVSFADDNNPKLAIINEANRLLNTNCSECHAKALEQLLPLADDSRSWNALGVALYLAGRQAEAIDYFRRAAANGNAEAKENLEKINNINH